MWEGQTQAFVHQFPSVTPPVQLVTNPTQPAKLNTAPLLTHTALASVLKLGIGAATRIPPTSPLYHALWTPSAAFSFEGEEERPMKRKADLLF